jgi:hypothetical protein
MPIRFTGASCKRPGCRRPTYSDDLCSRCWRLARMFGHDVRMFAYAPLNGWRDARDSVSVDWDRWDGEGRFDR